MKTFLQPLQNLAEMEEIQKQAKKNRGILEISGCMESQKAHLMYGLSGLFLFSGDSVEQAAISPLPIAAIT